MPLIRLYHELNSGVISALLTTVFSITCVSLVFANVTGDYLSIAIFLSLIGCVIMSAVATFGSPVHSNVIGTQDAIAIIVALSASELTGHSHLHAPETMFITVIMLVVTMTIFQGFATYLIGRFRLGKIIDYIPFPVLAGFLGGTGALIVVGTLEVSSGVNLFQHHFMDIFTNEKMVFWIPEVIFTIGAIFVIERYKSAFIFPIMMISVLIIYYSTTWTLGISQEAAAEAGYLLGPFPDFSIAQLSIFSHIPSTQWWMLWKQAPNYLIVTGLGIITMLVNIRSLEVSTHIYMNINKELKLNGLANFISGFFGSLGGYHYIAISIINFRLGARTVLSGIVRALVILGIALFGVPLLGYLPKSLFVVLLLFIGFYFIYEWLILTSLKISFHDYILIPVIALAIVLKGLLSGVILGSFICLVIFAIRCSRINIIKDTLRGHACSSYVEYSPLEKEILDYQRNSIRLFKLQSYIFYGNSVGLERKVAEEIHNSEDPIKYIIIDFDKVFGADSSTIFSFSKICLHCKNNGVMLIYSHITPGLMRNFKIANDSGLPMVYTEARDFDQALEICERDILKNHKLAKVIINEDITKRCLYPDIDKRKGFERYFNTKYIKEGKNLIEEGEEETNSLYIIKEGKVEVYTLSQNGEETRIKVLNKGRIFGELGLFLKIPRTASIRAVDDCTLLQLTETNLGMLKEDHPESVADLYLDVLNTTMGRFIDMNERARQLRL